MKDWGYLALTVPLAMVVSFLAHDFNKKPLDKTDYLYMVHLYLLAFMVMWMSVQ